MKSSDPSMRVWCAAFTMAEVLVVIAVIAFTALLVLPAMVETKSKRAKFNCSKNLAQIDLAFLTWAGDNKDHYPMSACTNAAGKKIYADATNAFRYFQAVSNEISNPSVLICPEDRKRRAATNFTSDFNGSHISYFIGLDAADIYPQSFLAGDSHLTIGRPLTNGIMVLTSGSPVRWTAERHDGSGNIAMADGSVQQFSTQALRHAAGACTNRLLMPR